MFSRLIWISCFCIASCHVMHHYHMIMLDLCRSYTMHLLRFPVVVASSRIRRWDVWATTRSASMRDSRQAKFACLSIHCLSFLPLISATLVFDSLSRFHHMFILQPIQLYPPQLLPVACLYVGLASRSACLELFVRVVSMSYLFHLLSMIDYSTLIKCCIILGYYN